MLKMANDLRFNKLSAIGLIALETCLRESKCIFVAVDYVEGTYFSGRFIPSHLSRVP